MAKAKVPLQRADELLDRYRSGERYFQNASLMAADLGGADLECVNLAKAELFAVNLNAADLLGADLGDANLTMADLAGARLRDADLRRANLNNADLRGADLRHADLSGASLLGTILTDATLTGATLVETVLTGASLLRTDFKAAVLGGTQLTSVDLSPFCAVRKSLQHGSSSSVDHHSIARSLHVPGLAEFLVDVGWPHVAAMFTLESFRSLNAADMFQLLHSTFISFGGPDQAFAKRLHKALTASGVKPWFFPESAKLGEPLFLEMQKGVNKHDRMLLICSKSSLDRPGLLNEIVEMRAREAREGGQWRIIPVVLDDHLFNGWEAAQHPGLGQNLRDRVCGDFRDPGRFDAELLRVIEALKRPRPIEAKAPVASVA